ncbi:MAG TPA: hypothetical protein PLA71_00625 [Saccharofermentans sp.]|mgnify:CR=1 FL=1|nr:hypothetical protein [Saccharofermentans sp.]
MKLDDAIKMMDAKNNRSMFEVKLPNGSTNLFKHFNLRQRKNLAKVALGEEDNKNSDYQIAKLGLMKDCCPELDIDKMTILDFVSALAQLRLNNIAAPLTYTITCKKCDSKFRYVFDLCEVVEKCAKAATEKPKFERVELLTGDISFVLGEASLTDHISFYRILEHVKEKEERTRMLLSVYPIQFIKKIFITGNEIEDWSDNNFVDKLLFVENHIQDNSIDVEKYGESNLFSLILNAYPFDRLDKVFPIVSCSKCGDAKEGLFDLDSFFTD